MKRLSFILVLLFIPVFSVFGQTPTATPPTEDDGIVVKISTNLIQLDVVVTDKKSNQITDLQPTDFEIFENGGRQEITPMNGPRKNTRSPRAG